MKNSSRKKPQPPTLTDHISFGAVGLGPNGERFIYITIEADGQQRKVLFRYDDVNGSRATTYNIFHAQKTRREIIF